jgi:hypothetical protein
MDPHEHINFFRGVLNAFAISAGVVAICVLTAYAILALVN